MTNSTQLETKSPSRRALLAGALGGIGAWAASALGGPAAVHATDPNDVVLGGDNIAGNTTGITWNSDGDVIAGHSSGSGDVLNGYAASGRGVYGASGSNVAVWAYSNAK